MNEFGYCSTDILFFKNDVRGVSIHDLMQQYQHFIFQFKKLGNNANKNWTYKTSMKCLEHLLPLFPLVAF